jgi:hypothetical protein
MASRASSRAVELSKPVERHEEGLAIIGSSNLTLSGVTHNTELNVLVQGNDNHAELGKWFDGLWDESQEFDESLMQEMKQSWAVASARPYDVYMKALYTLVCQSAPGRLHVARPDSHFVIQAV